MSIGPLRHIDPGDLSACRRVDENLPVRDVDVALLIDRHTLASALNKRLEIAERAVCTDQPAIRDIFRFATDVNPVPRVRPYQSVRIKAVRKPPAARVR